MSGHGSWARIAAAVDGSDAEADRDGLASELERVEVELQDERTARLLVDNELQRVLDAVADHERALMNRAWGTSAKEADRALWKVLDGR